MSDESWRHLRHWEVIDSRLVVDASPWLRLRRETVRLPDGRLVSDYYQLDQPDYAEVFAVTGADRVIGLWRYKHGSRSVNLGLPAGYLAPGESPLTAARRELFEETGYQADDWQSLGSFTVDGNRGCGQAHIFLARGARLMGDPDPDDLEELQIELIGIHDLDLHLRAGRVTTLGAATAIALGLRALESADQSGSWGEKEM